MSKGERLTNYDIQGGASPFLSDHQFMSKWNMIKYPGVVMVSLIMSWENNVLINNCPGGSSLNCVQGLNFPHCSSIGGVQLNSQFNQHARHNNHIWVTSRPLSGLKLMMYLQSYLLVVINSWAEMTNDGSQVTRLAEHSHLHCLLEPPKMLPRDVMVKIKLQLLVHWRYDCLVFNALANCPNLSKALTI